MKQFAAIMLVVLVAGCSACRTGQSGSDARSSDESSADATTTASEPEATPNADPVSQARDAVETARLLAMPVEPLAEDTIQGFALPLYAELPDLSYEQMLAAVRENGASHVSIVVSWDQRTIYSNTIRPNPDKTPDDSRIGEVIEAAHSQGLQVMLFPIIHVKLRNDGEWRGKMAPENVERWKEEYTKFVLHYASVANRHGVEFYSVGSELGSLEHDEAFWRDLIGQTRVAYNGKLLYSANWDHYTTPKFWEALDYIGVSSYFEIARDEDDTVFEMVERWQTYRTDLLRFAREQKRPLLLTEVGYPSLPTAATKPWDYTQKGEPDGNAQLAAYRALSQAWTPPAATEGAAADFAGLFIWHAWGPGGTSDASYSIWKKPSERFIEAWYAR